MDEKLITIHIQIKYKLCPLLFSEKGFGFVENEASRLLTAKGLTNRKFVTKSFPALQSFFNLAINLS